MEVVMSDSERMAKVVAVQTEFETLGKHIMGSDACNTARDEMQRHANQTGQNVHLELWSMTPDPEDPTVLRKIAMHFEVAPE